MKRPWTGLMALTYLISGCALGEPHVFEVSDSQTQGNDDCYFSGACFGSSGGGGPFPTGGAGAVGGSTPTGLWAATGGGHSGGSTFVDGVGGSFGYPAGGSGTGAAAAFAGASAAGGGPTGPK